jgi:2-keto-4-pentenoate hydratase
VSRDELSNWACRFLHDYDALAPWQSFTPDAGLTREQAYALQAEIARLREDRGERIIGYKIGCTSRAIQEQLGIGEPIFGRLFDTGCFPADSRLAHGHFANLAIEGELAIRLSRDLPGHSFPGEEYVSAIDTVFPVIELHHYLLPAHRCALPGLIASSGMHAGLVLPERETDCSNGVPTVPELEVAISDRLAGTTSEPWTMGGPAEALRWLSARLAESGLQLRRGQVILTGSALPLFPVAPSTRVTVTAGSLGRSYVAID